MNQSAKHHQKKLHEPKVISKAEHGISLKFINHHAIDIVKKLHAHGFEGYIVGGGIRDLLLNKRPKDFDVVTDALPNQIKKIFHNCRIIGKRFRLAHVYFGSSIIDVATFRATDSQAGGEERKVHHQGIIIRDNVYGSLDQDASRRDFTINAFYYDVDTEQLKDFFNGFEDLKNGIIRVIGDPDKRYREDPVRILRAIRFAGKLGFKLEEKTEKNITKLVFLLNYIPAARLYDEVLKLLYQGDAESVFSHLKTHHLLWQLFPVLKTHIPSEQKKDVESFIQMAFHNTDLRIKKNQSINQSFLFAVLLWMPVFVLWQQSRRSKGGYTMEAFHQAARNIFNEQRKYMAIPRRVFLVMETIWRLQYYLENRKAKQISKLIDHHRFRAAYDLLFLRASVWDSLKPSISFWSRFQQADEQQREKMIQELK